MAPQPPHLVPIRSRGLPGWLVAVLGVLLAAGALLWWFVSNAPPDTDEKARASYQAGFEAGKRRAQQEDARRTEGRSTEPAPER